MLQHKCSFDSVIHPFGTWTELELKPRPGNSCCSKEGAKRHFPLFFAELQLVWSLVGEMRSVLTAANKWHRWTTSDSSVLPNQLALTSSLLSTYHQSATLLDSARGDTPRTPPKKTEGGNPPLFYVVCQKGNYSGDVWFLSGLVCPLRSFKTLWIQKRGGLCIH